jgi:type III secretory pathway component EscS
MGLIIQPLHSASIFQYISLRHYLKLVCVVVTVTKHVKGLYHYIYSIVHYQIYLLAHF